MIGSDKFHEAIHRRYPRLFARRIALECGPGWYPLLDDLFQTLEHYIELGLRRGEWPIPVEGATDDHGLPAWGWPVARQIKEKFGGLRVHMSAWNPAMRAAIETAKDRADATCDQCAEAGTLRDLSGYLCTRCAVHAHSRGW